MGKSIETIGLKNISIDFLNNEIQHLFVVQGDTKTRGLLVRIKDNNGNTIPASTEYELRLYAKYADEAKLLYSVADIVDEQYRVYLTTDMLRKVGTLIIQLALYKDNVELIQSKQSSLQVHPSMTCQIGLGEDKVIDIIKMQESLDEFEEKLDKLKNFDGFDGLADLKKGEEERKQAERLRVQEESIRSENESTRKDTEDKRKESENRRESSELSRIEIEKQRVSNEEIRQANEEKRIASEDERKQKYELYQSNEEKRIEQENARASKEELRISEEQKRSEQESSRIKADQERNSKEVERSSNEEKRSQQESERVQAEQTRISNEQNRGEAEQVRINNEEERKTNELNRIEAEKQRQTKDSERDIKFGEWNKKIESLGNTPGELPEIPKIERATETTAGVVKLKSLSEEDDTAVSYNLYNKAITEKEQAINAKIEKQDIKLSAYDESIKSLGTKTDELTNKLDTKATKEDINTLTNDLSSKASKSHTHAITDVTNLETKLAEKASNGDLADVRANVDKKADKKHTHTTADITDLETVLSSKASQDDIKNLTTQISTKASQDDINKLSTELTEKVNSFSITPATSTVAGIVRIDTDGETVAASKKTVDEINNSLNESDMELAKELNRKVDKNTVDEKMNNLELLYNNAVNGMFTGLENLKSKISTNTTEIDSTKKIVNGNFSSILTISTTLDNKASKDDLDNKASKTHTHTISDVDGLKNELDKKVSSDTVKNIAIIEKGASTNNIPANTLIFEKE